MSELDDQDGFDVSEYADQLQQALRSLDATGPDRWRQLVERGLGEAYRQRNALGLASMVQVVVSFLDASGRFDDAVTEIDHALSLAHGDPDAVAMLEALRACFLGVMGRTTLSLEAAATAERAAAVASQPQAVTKSRCHSAVARLMALQEIDVSKADALVAGGTEQLRDGDALLLLSYLLPYLFARGERELAHPRLRAFRLAAEAAGHEWRLGDAAAFETAEKSVSEPLTTIPLETINTWNWLGRWRVQLGRFRAAHLRRDLRSCQEETTALLRARRRAGKADFDSIGAVEGYHEAFLGGGAAPVQLNPPEEAHLLNLPSILVGAEAVSLAGTQAMAMRWLAWLGAKLPDQFQTSLEWPVARARVEALLLLRSGDLRGAKSRFEKAIAWAAQAGYPSEQALAQVQLAELLFHGSFSATVRAWRPFRAEGWETLQAMGVDPAPFAYDVARLVGLASDRSLSPGLTRREAEVLALLAEGLTYKAIAERLGVRWPTVQSLAHRCYDKLDVAGRWPAVEVGRELGII